MVYGPPTRERTTADFILRCNIYPEADARVLGFDSPLRPAISAAEHYTEDGADFRFTQLDYYDGNEAVAARMIAEILPGNRTNLALWHEPAPPKQLTVHVGRCDVVIGHRDTRITEEARYSEGSNLTLPPGVFYTLRAPEDSTQATVISGFYKHPMGDWAKLETAVQPGAHEVQTAEGAVIKVPESFRRLFA